MSGRRTPTSTYRVQLRPGLGFDEARARLGYLSRLGVSHLYLSPIFEAMRGSPHGYDVTDPTRVREELGGRVGFEALATAARAQGMGIVIDIVPNHLAAHEQNPWWRSVLREGRGSPGAEVFDIDWERAGGRVVLPVLAVPLEEVLARDEIGLERSGDEPALAYFDRRFPLRPDVRVPDAPGRGALRALLERQHYELVHWRVGTRRRNYRRFFDIDGLVGVRVEEAGVFERTHSLAGELWDAGLIAGVRVDHVDGLARPGEYLRRLAERLVGRGDDAPWIVVEKILGHAERLPRAWRVDGTTGYEAMNAITRVFVGRGMLDRMRKIAAGAGACASDFGEVVASAKREVLGSLFAGELEVLSARVARAPGCDAGVEGVRSALTELIVELDVYRTYLTDDPHDPDSRARLRAAAAKASRRAPRAGRIAELLTQSEECARLFEQLSGPVMAKGVEDTAHYRHAVLTALNEVGGEAAMDAEDPLGRFHREWEDVEAVGGLAALTTHDTKRSADARARILALAEAPEAWRELLKGALAGAEGRGPAPTDMVFLLQAAMAIHPGRDESDDGWVSRLRDYVVKAAREGKERTSWTEPDLEYEEALRGACDRLARGGSLAGLLERTADRIAARAREISLVQTVLHLTGSRPPDVYQGTEVAFRALVDPDNRRATDFDALEDRLGRIDREGVRREDFDDLKLHVTSSLLRLRRAHAGVFERGGRRAFGAPDQPGIVGFVRTGGDDRVCVAVAPGREAVSRRTLRVPLSGAWRDVLSGRELEIGSDGEVADPWVLCPGVVLVRA